MTKKDLNNYEVSIYYTGYCNYTVKAKNKDEALAIAKAKKINRSELFNNLEPWREADTVTKI